MTGGPPAEVVLATRSTGKLAELQELFAAHGIIARDLSALGIEEEAAEEGLEIHATFEENAWAKAAWFAHRLAGRTVIADDSGLEVAALGGAPGVRSKRWSLSDATGVSGAALDAANNATLLRAIAPHADRSARYVTVVVARAGSREWSARGECTGIIVDIPRGEGGFGYDPYFLSDDLGRTFAEVSRTEKARVSHRARAFRALLAQWASR